MASVCYVSGPLGRPVAFLHDAQTSTVAGTAIRQPQRGSENPKDNVYCEDIKRNAAQTCKKKTPLASDTRANKTLERRRPCN